MELQEFFIKFLPNFVERIKNRFPGRLGWEQEAIFFRQNFPEALGNYTNLICKKQREKCRNAVTYTCMGDDVEDAVYNAPQPKIEEI